MVEEGRGLRLPHTPASIGIIPPVSGLFSGLLKDPPKHEHDNDGNRGRAIKERAGEPSRDLFACSRRLLVIAFAPIIHPEKLPVSMGEVARITLPQDPSVDRAQNVPSARL